MLRKRASFSLLQIIEQLYLVNTMAAFNANNAVCLNVGRIAAVLLLFIGLITVTQRSEHGQRLTTAISGAAKALPKPWSPSQAPSELSFYEVGKLHDTDKVTTHSYQNMYEKYLPDLRHKKIKMLEIGLGCDMVRDSTDAWWLTRSRCC